MKIIDLEWVIEIFLGLFIFWLDLLVRRKELGAIVKLITLSHAKKQLFHNSDHEH